jgi:transketolase
VKRLVVEAGVEAGVAVLLRPGDRFHGMQSFGSSGPYGELAEHFGFTTPRLIALARGMI